MGLVDWFSKILSFFLYFFLVKNAQAELIIKILIAKYLPQRLSLLSLQLLCLLLLLFLSSWIFKC